MSEPNADFPHHGDESHLLREVMRAHQAMMNSFSRKVGIPVARLSLMRLLAVSYPEELGVMEIARRLGVNAAAITRQVKGMEAECLVERVADDRDARRHYIKLTAEGQRIFLHLHQRAHEFECSLSALVSAEEIATAARVLSQLRNVLETLDRK